MSNTLLDKLVSKVPSLRQRFVRKQGEFAAQIWDVLDRNNWTQQDLAVKLDKKESYVSRLLRGNGNPTLKTICAIEEALGEEILVAPGYYEVCAPFGNTMGFLESQYAELRISGTASGSKSSKELQYIPGNAAQQGDVVVSKNEFVPVNAVVPSSIEHTMGTMSYRGTGS